MKTAPSKEELWSRADRWDQLAMGCACIGLALVLWGRGFFG